MAETISKRQGTDRQHKRRIDKEIRGLKKDYSRAGDKIEALLTDTANAQPSPGGRRRREEQLFTIMDDLNQSVLRRAPRLAQTGYARGADLGAAAIFATDTQETIQIGTPINESAIDAVSEQITRDLVSANATMQGSADRFLRALSPEAQAIISDLDVSDIIREGLIQGQTLAETAGAIESEIRKVVDGQQFITINGRRYNIEKYAEMVGLTRTREATTQGTIDALAANGMDLVKVSEHSHEEDVCSNFQGKTYSISGNDPDFPPLGDRPPFHPRCKHVLIPQHRGTLEGRGDLDQAISDSNSEKVDFEGGASEGKG